MVPGLVDGDYEQVRDPPGDEVTCDKGVEDVLHEEGAIGVDAVPPVPQRRLTVGGLPTRVVVQYGDVLCGAPGNSFRPLPTPVTRTEVLRSLFEGFVGVGCSPGRFSFVQP